MPKTLLLADDSVTIQKVVGLSFANEDIVLVTVSNGDDAVTRARELRPDLVLADVVMPGKNGYEVCETLKNDPELRHIPVLLLTGTFEAFDQERARRAGADGHVTKPFEAQALVRQSMELMARSAKPGAAAAEPAAKSAQAAAAEDPFFAEDFGDDFPAVMGVQAEPLPADSDAAADELELATVAEDDLEGADDDTLFGTSPPAAVAGDSADDLDDAPAFVPDTTDSDLLSPRAVAPRPTPELPDADFDLGFDETPAPAQRDSDAETLLAPPPANLFGEDDPSGDENRDPGRAQGFDLSFSDLDDPLASTRGELHQEPAADFSSGDAATTFGTAAGEPSTTFGTAASEPSTTFGTAAGEAATTFGTAAGEAATPATEESDETSDLSAQQAFDAPSEPAFDAAPASASEEPSASTFGASAAPDFHAEPAAETEAAEASAFDSGSDFEAMPGFERERVPAPEPPASPAAAAERGVDLGPMLRERLHDTLEKVAWEAFSDLSDTIVRQALERVEQIAWEVIPQMAEQLIREEIRRMKGDSESD